MTIFVNFGGLIMCDKVFKKNIWYENFKLKLIFAQIILGFEPKTLTLEPSEEPLLHDLL